MKVFEDKLRIWCMSYLALEHYDSFRPYATVHSVSIFSQRILTF